MANTNYLQRWPERISSSLKSLWHRLLRRGRAYELLLPGNVFDCFKKPLQWRLSDRPLFGCFSFTVEVWPLFYRCPTRMDRISLLISSRGETKARKTIVNG